MPKQESHPSDEKAKKALEAVKEVHAAIFVGKPIVHAVKEARAILEAIEQKATELTAASKNKNVKEPKEGGSTPTP